MKRGRGRPRKSKNKKPRSGAQRRHAAILKLIAGGIAPLAEKFNLYACSEGSTYRQRRKRYRDTLCATDAEIECGDEATKAEYMAYALETWIKGQEVLQGWPKADGEVYSHSTISRKDISRTILTRTLGSPSFSDTHWLVRPLIFLSRSEYFVTPPPRASELDGLAPTTIGAAHRNLLLPTYSRPNVASCALGNSRS